jgi:rRNA maturation RNase YbeY
LIVEFRCKVRAASGNARALRADAKALMRILGLAAHELSVVIVGDREMRQLNRRFRRKDRPTDVLSFSQLETVGKRGGQIRLPARLRVSDGLPGSSQPLGDVVISVETARRQSKEMGLGLQARLRSLLIHGVLHLLGYEHERSRSNAEVMFAKERALASELDRAGFKRIRSR